MKAVLVFLWLGLLRTESNMTPDSLISVLGKDRMAELTQLQAEGEISSGDISESSSDESPSKPPRDNFAKAYDLLEAKDEEMLKQVEFEIQNENEDKTELALDRKDDEEEEPDDESLYNFSDIVEKLNSVNCDTPEKEEAGLEIIEGSGDSFEIKSLCRDVIHASTLSIVGESNRHSNELYDYLKKYVYLPLSLDVQPRLSFAEVLLDLIFIDDSTLMVNKDTQIPTNEQFLHEVTEIFKTIETYSSEFEANKGLISNLILDVLKRFHIFWNVHRNRNQIETVGKNTIQIVKHIIKNYKKTSKHMKDVAQHIVTNIKDGFYRFSKAHQIQTLIQKKPVEMIALQIVRRYKENVESIIAAKPNSNQFNSELGYLLDLLRGFFVLNFRLKVSDSENKNRYQTAIFDKIKMVYETYASYMKENDHQSLNFVRDFTITLLLKFNFRQFMIFNVYGINWFLSLPVFGVRSSNEQIVKIYYIWIDRLMLIPKICSNEPNSNLESCYRKKIGMVESELFLNYNLPRSVAGHDLINFMRMAIFSMFEKARKTGLLASSLSFRNFYFSELFVISEEFRAKYFIKSMPFFDEIENELGGLISSHKHKNVMKKKIFELFNKLDSLIYNFFLNSKSKYNNLQINEDLSILNTISLDFSSLLDKFRVNHYEMINDDVEDCLVALKKTCENLISSRANESMLANTDQNSEKPITQYTPLVQPNSDIVEHVVNEPMISSRSMIPSGNPSAPMDISQLSRAN